MSENQNIDTPVDTDKFEVVYTKEFSSSPTLGKLAAALAKAKLKMPAKVEPDQVNNYYGNKYASLGKILDTITKPLAENGLVLSQDAGTSSIHTMLIHESGEWKSSITGLYPKDKGMHGWGGSTTYGKRFAISAMVGVATDEDDDGGDGKSKGDEGGSRKGGGSPPPQAPSVAAPIGSDVDSIKAALQNAKTSQEINKIAYTLNQSVKSGEVSPSEANEITEIINERKAATAR